MEIMVLYIMPIAMALILFACAKFIKNKQNSFEEFDDVDDVIIDTYGIVGRPHSGRTSVSIENVIKYHKLGYMVVYINSEERIEGLYQRIRDLSGTDEDLDIMIRSYDICKTEDIDQYMTGLIDSNTIESTKPRVYIFDINATPKMVLWVLKNRDMFNAEDLIMTVSTKSKDEPLGGVMFDGDDVIECGLDFTNPVLEVSDMVKEPEPA